MKNMFKFGFLALAISLSVAACNSEKKSEGTDTTITDSSTIVTDVDTSVKDSTVKDTTVTATTTTVDSVKK
jgi:ABC-type glycerol-3-phosphate transport system substrate-binding protein